MADVAQSIQSIFTRIQVIRAIITFVLIAWLVVFTILTLRIQFSPADIEQSSTSGAAPTPTDPESMKYFNLHRIWFGDSSIVLILFQVWYLTALMLVFGKLVGPAIKYYQAK